jgi:hypothetical protein
LHRAAETSGDFRAHAAKAAILHHAAHHRSHGLHQHGEAPLANLRLHHFQHRRHLRHHVGAATAKTAELHLGVVSANSNNSVGRLAHHHVSTSHG